ncbi:MAG: hypothetical protein M3Y67_03020 [Pseudomonadota bacterium]|nr:hypothetical protein [Pseudomonadota bacterium]
MKTLSIAPVIAFAALFAGAASAQVLYRCGNEYTSVPCANGRALETADVRSPVERAEARGQIADQKRLAAKMERDRRREEAAIRPALAGSLSAPHAAVAAASAASKSKKASPKKKRFNTQTADEGDFIAGVPGSGKKKR